MTPEQIEQLVRELMKTGELLASEAFRIALQQVKVEIFQSFVGSTTCGLVAICLAFWGRKQQEFFLWLFACIFGTGSIFLVSDGISRMINPEWYAIKLLLTTFLGE